MEGDVAPQAERIRKIRTRGEQNDASAYSRCGLYRGVNRLGVKRAAVPFCSEIGDEKDSLSLLAGYVLGDCRLGQRNQGPGAKSCASSLQETTAVIDHGMSV